MTELDCAVYLHVTGRGHLCLFCRVEKQVVSQEMAD